MKKTISLVAVFTALAMLCVMSVSALPTWTVDKSSVVTGDYKWDGNSWTLPSPAPITATYQFQASGKGFAALQESEALGQAWLYDYHNQLTSSDSGSLFAGATVSTVNDPATTPGTAYTQFAFGVQNTGHYSSSQLVVTGNGFADISHSAVFTGDFVSKNFFCVNDCAN